MQQSNWSCWPTKSTLSHWQHVMRQEKQAAGECLSSMAAIYRKAVNSSCSWLCRTGYWTRSVLPTLFREAGSICKALLLKWHSSEPIPVLLPFGKEPWPNLKAFKFKSDGLDPTSRSSFTSCSGQMVWVHGAQGLKGIPSSSPRLYGS